MADHQAWRHAARLQVAGRAHKVIDVGGECRICELALGMAKTGEVKAQHGNPHCGEACCNATGRGDVFSAGEAMRKERSGQMRSFGHVQPGGEVIAGMTGECEAFNRHQRESFPHKDCHGYPEEQGSSQCSHGNLRIVTEERLCLGRHTSKLFGRPVDP